MCGEGNWGEISDYTMERETRRELCELSFLQ